MTGQRVTAALFIDCGEGRANGPGRFTYTRPPRARYECLLCHTAEGPVTGPERVREFVARIRTDHPNHCTANQQGAKAA